MRPPVVSRRASARRGLLASTELIFVLPILVYVCLVVLQFVIIYATYQRVQMAAIEGACIAAQGGIMDDVEDAVGLGLGHLASGGFEVTRQYVDADASTSLDAMTDHVVVGVRIPMNRASINYLGLLGGDVDLLQIRSVVKKKLRVSIPEQPGMVFDGGP